MKFRKKPVVIEATQWFKDGDHPKVFIDALGDAYIATLEGVHIVTKGDWIITGVKGEHYPCKPDIFEMTYEPAGDDHIPDAKKMVEQDPFGYFRWTVDGWEDCAETDDGAKALYEKPFIAQQQRTWVGLTDEEANELWESTDSDWELMKRVEAKLKEKNT